MEPICVETGRGAKALPPSTRQNMLEGGNTSTPSSPPPSHPGWEPRILYTIFIQYYPIIIQDG